MNRADQDSPWFHDPRWLAFRAQGLAAPNEGPVYTYQSSHDPWFTSSYYFETELGVVLFDTQIFPQSAAELLSDITANTSGRLHCIVITHAHPDHYWGNSVFRAYDPGVPIITSTGVLREMHDTAAALVTNMPPLWHDVTAHTLVFPELAFETPATLAFDDINVLLSECGPAENRRQLVGWIPEHEAVITGDLLQNHLTYAVQMQAVGAWRAIVAEIAQLKPKRILTGHIGVAGPEILDETIEWFDALLELTGRELGPDVDPGSFALLEADARGRIARELQDRFPAWWDATMFGSEETIVEWSLRFSREQIGSKVTSAPERSLPSYR